MTWSTFFFPNLFRSVLVQVLIKCIFDRALKTVTEEDARKFPMINGEGKKVVYS